MGSTGIVISDIVRRSSKWLLANFSCTHCLIATKFPRHRLLSHVVSMGSTCTVYKKGTLKWLYAKSSCGRC